MDRREKAFDIFAATSIPCDSSAMPMPAADARRDAKIFALWWAGISRADLAERFGLKPRTIEAVVNRAKAAAEIAKEPPRMEARA